LDNQARATCSRSEKNAFAITSDNENKPDLTKKTAEYINIFIYFAAVSFLGEKNADKSIGFIQCPLKE
jgi:hypothetical protein